MCVCTNSTQVYTFLQKQQSQFDSPTICNLFDWSEQGLLVKPRFRAPMELDLGLMDIAKQKRYIARVQDLAELSPTVST